jgi:hypothetical protein
MLVPALAACPSSDPSVSELGLTEDPRGLWFVNDPGSVETIDHSIWDAFVQKYVRVRPHGVNRVDYDAVTTEDHLALKQYLADMGRVEIARYNRDEQIAFWMNLYNAAMVDLVLDNPQADSVLQIRGPGINVVGPWLRPVAKIHGRAVSFNDIEHYILREAFNDMGMPIHYGVNCASMGCPSISPRAHTGQNWRENLKRTAHQFINCKHGVHFEDGKLFTSKIYDSWFKDDFGGTDAKVIAHLLKYAEPELAAELKKHKTISGDFYDWRLNQPGGT